MKFLKTLNALRIYLQRWLKVALISRNFNAGKLSVIVPIYNDEKYILSCLKSIQRQHYKNFECIIVNDASSDSSVALIKSFIAQDPRFILVSHQNNLGLSAARNTGISHARGEFITFLDSDDWVFPLGFAERIRVLASHNEPHVAGVYGAIAILPESPTPFQIFKSSFAIRALLLKDFLSSKGECPFNVHAPVLRRSAVQLTGNFDVALRSGGEDWDYWNRMLRLGYSFPALPYACAVYRQKKSNMRSQSAFQHIQKSFALMKSSTLSYEVAPNIESKLAWMPFKKPLHEHSLDLLMSKRASEYVAMCLVEGNLGAAQSILKLLSADQWKIGNRYSLFKEVPIKVATSMGLREEALINFKSNLETLLGQTAQAPTPIDVH